MPSSSSNKAKAAPTSAPMQSPKSDPKNNKPSQPSHTSHHPHKNQATSHPHSTTPSSSSHPKMDTTKKSSHPNEGPATTAYKLAQKNIPPREPTPQGSTASSQACESGDVSESERGVLRRERKDVIHWGPGGERGGGQW
ncbi:MAG: hypothetical protein Q9182_004022 [Xanthomendoza sp. 2 TL-2023]